MLSKGNHKYVLPSGFKTFQRVIKSSNDIFKDSPEIIRNSQEPANQVAKALERIPEVPKAFPRKNSKVGKQFKIIVEKPLENLLQN